MCLRIPRTNGCYLLSGPVIDHTPWRVPAVSHTYIIHVCGSCDRRLSAFTMRHNHCNLRPLIAVFPRGVSSVGSMAPVRPGLSVALISVCRGGYSTTIDSTCCSCEPVPIVHDINNLFFCSREQPMVSSPHLSLSRYVFCLAVVLNLVRLFHIYAVLINNCLSGLLLI